MPFKISVICKSAYAFCVISVCFAGYMRFEISPNSCQENEEDKRDTTKRGNKNNNFTHSAARTQRFRELYYVLYFIYLS